MEKQAKIVHLQGRIEAVNHKRRHAVTPTEAKVHHNELHGLKWLLNHVVTREGK